MPSTKLMLAAELARRLTDRLPGCRSDHYGNGTIGVCPAAVSGRAWRTALITVGDRLLVSCRIAQQDRDLICRDTELDYGDPECLEQLLAVVAAHCGDDFM